MTPNLIGRIQTRIFLIGVIGSLIALVITPVLPRIPPGFALSSKYAAIFVVLAVVIVVGFAWELLYHAYQQYRWERDWPQMLVLLVGIPEGIVAYNVIRSGVFDNVFGKSSDVAILLHYMPRSTFLIAFTVVWVGTYLFVSGPMRVPFLRWRFNGGRLI